MYFLRTVVGIQEENTVSNAFLDLLATQNAENAYEKLEKSIIVINVIREVLYRAMIFAGVKYVSI